MWRIGWAIVLCAAGCLDVDELTRGGAPDGAVAANPDLAARDQAMAPVDLAGSDLAGIDQAVPDLIAPLDFSTVADLAKSADAGCKMDIDCGGGVHKCCNGTCVDSSGDPGNCGACGRSCNAPFANVACVASQCVIQSCAAGWGDCDHVEQDGCEVDIGSDPSHCGTCNLTMCMSCNNGMCGNPDFLMPMLDAGKPPSDAGALCPPPTACNTGTDPVSGNSFILCGNGARVAQNNGAGGSKYYVDIICQCLGFIKAINVGTDALNACNGSCNVPGPYMANPPPCGLDQQNRYFCQAPNNNSGLEWVCQ